MTTLQLSPFQRLLSLTTAIVIALTLFVGAAAHAQTTRAGFYQADLVAAAHDAHAVAGDVLWSCDGTSCTAPRGTSRPAIICARFVRHFGQVSRFVANGEALDAAALAHCNAA